MEKIKYKTESHIENIKTTIKIVTLLLWRK